MKRSYDHSYISDSNTRAALRDRRPNRNTPPPPAETSRVALIRLALANPSLAEQQLEATLGFDLNSQQWIVCSFDVWREGWQVSECARIFHSCLNSVTDPEENGDIEFLSYVDDAGDPAHAKLQLLFWAPTQERVSRLCRSLALRLSDAFKNNGLQSACGMGSAYASFLEIRESLNESLLALSRRYTRAPGIFAYQRENELRGMSCRDFECFPDLFCRALRKADRVEVQTHIEALFDKLEHSDASVRRVNQDIQKLFSALADLAAQQLNGGNEFQLVSLEPYYHVFDYAQGPPQLRLMLQKLCALILEFVLKNGTSFADRKIAEFRVYIEDHFMDLDLNVDSVGQLLQISPSYLRKLLKRSLGTTFVEFVTAYRMERAKELLTGSDLTSYQVAEQIGYPYAHYFSAIFKRRVGMSPSDFRSLRRKGA